MASRELTSMKKTEDLCNWILGHAGEPCITAAFGSDERKYAVWLSRRRHAVKNGYTILEKEQGYLDSVGLPDLFKTGARQVRSAGLSELYALWMSIKGKEPTSEDVDPIGSLLYRWVTRKRSGESNTYETDTTALEATNVPNILDRLTREDLSNFMALSFCQFYKSHNEVEPRKTAADKSEAKLAHWVANRRQAAKGNVKVQLYKTDKAIFDSFGLGALLV